MISRYLPYRPRALAMLLCVVGQAGLAFAENVNSEWAVFQSSASSGTSTKQVIVSTPSQSASSSSSPPSMSTVPMPYNLTHAAQEPSPDNARREPVTAAAPASGRPPSAVSFLPALPPLGAIRALPGSSAGNLPSITMPVGPISPAVNGQAQAIARRRSSPTRTQVVYKQIMPNGAVSYSDTPVVGATVTKRLDSRQVIEDLRADAHKITLKNDRKHVKEALPLQSKTHLRRDKTLRVATKIDMKRAHDRIRSVHPVSAASLSRRGERLSRTATKNFSDKTAHTASAHKQKREVVQPASHTAKTKKQKRHD